MAGGGITPVIIAFGFVLPIGNSLGNSLSTIGNQDFLRNILYWVIEYDMADVDHHSWWGRALLLRLCFPACARLQTLG